MNTVYGFAQLQSEVGGNAERLAYIDFKLRFTGHVKRRDLYDEFGLAEAAASRMMTLYNSFRKENHFYDRKAKVNSICLESFEPLVPIDSETALGMLVNGFNKNKLMDRPLVSYRRIGRAVNQLDVESVSTLTRAMFNHQAISCCYISGNSLNHGERELVPLSFINDGRNWMFRAYDRSELKKKDKFKIFTLSRATEIRSLSGESAKGLAYESLKNDELWNRQVPLALKLHSNLSDKQKSTVRKDFGMPIDKNEFFLTESAALVWMITKLWNIDIGRVDSKDSFYKFELINKEMIRQYC